MKQTAFLSFSFLMITALLSSITSMAQVTPATKRTTPVLRTTNIKAVNPSSDSLKIFGNRNQSAMININKLKQTVQSVGTKFSPYKAGMEVPANNLGSHDEKSLFQVTINGSWSVSSGAIALEPSRGLINYSLKLENGKKYVIKLVYNKNHYGSLLVHTQLSGKNGYDIVQDEAVYTLGNTLSGKKEDELSFIVSPYLYDDYQKKKFTAGAEVECYLQISLTKDFISEKGKTLSHSGDYNMNVFKLVVKEVDF